MQEEKINIDYLGLKSWHFVSVAYEIHMGNDYR